MTEALQNVHTAEVTYAAREENAAESVLEAAIREGQEALALSLIHI